ncbi:MAG: PAS domain S-box protein [Pseudomonadota bacterium]
MGGSSASISIADTADPALPLVYVNEAFEILSGYSRSQVLGENCRFLSAEDPDSPERVRLREAVATRQPGVFELRNQRADGSIFWNRLSLYPVDIAETGNSYLVATQEDITGTREAQEDRDEARAQLLSALAGTREGFLLLDKNGIVQVVNARFRDFYGSQGNRWSRGRPFVEAWADRLMDLGMSQDEAQHAARDRLALIGEGNKNREEQLPDGRVLHVSDTVIMDAGYVSVVTDVTSVKATERRLAERMLAIDTAQDGVAITDDAGRFVYLNPSHVTMFGYESPRELIGNSWEKLYRPEQIKHLTEHAMPILQLQGRWRGDIKGIRKDGSEILQDVSLTRLDEVGLVCVTRDISDRVRGESERARLREQLAQAQRQEAIGHLAAGISHDFNNVLAVIMGSARLIDCDDNPAIAEHVARITAAGDQAQQLIRRLLDFGAREPQRVTIDLCRPVREAIALVRSGLPAGITLETSLPTTPLMAHVDRTDLTQVVMNLALNARDAMPDGGELAISLKEPDTPSQGIVPAIGRLVPDHKYALLTISDTGCGISSDEVAGIFEPYISTKGADGTGLGLAVVASIVSTVKGALCIDTRVGHGTEFSVYWPLKTIEERTPERPAASHDPELLKGSNLIVIDDDQRVAEIIAAALEKSGAEVATCTDPRDALEAVEENPDFWDAVITDFDMPGMTGADLSRRIREMHPHKAIVLCTALLDWRRRADTGDALFDSVLQKPVDPDVLVATVAGAITR